MATEDAAASAIERSVDSPAFPVELLQYSMTGVARSGHVTAPACIGPNPLQVPHEVNER